MTFIRPLKAASLLALLGVKSSAFADYTLNLHQGVTPISQDIYHLHMIILWICVGIGLCVFAVMFYAIIFHRKTKHPIPANFHESPVVEILWTLVPFVILTAMAFPATNVLIRMDDTKDSDLTIKVTGYQWKWEYEYLGKNVKFMSTLSTPNEQVQNRDMKGEHYLLEVDYPIVVPINKKIRFLTTSNDVIHSWWVHALGIKRDAVPGYINEAWARIEKPGIYRGQCAELCGAHHAFMPIVVIAKTQTEFEEWLQAQKNKDLAPKP